LIVLLGALLAMSCGKSSVKVTKVDLEQRIDSVTEKIWFDVRTELSMGNTTLPNLKFPIQLPGKGLVGGLEIGQNFIFVTINLSEVAKLRAYESVLPNGERLPLINDNQVVILEAGAGKKIKIYLSLTAGSKATGITIPINEFDKLGAELKTPSSLFLPFDLAGTNVLAGIYTSPDAGKNGLGVFVDLGKIFSSLMVQGYWVENHEDGVGRNLNFEAVEVDGETYGEIQKFLGKQHRKRRRFSVGQ